jgi:hypothetical protein
MAITQIQRDSPGKSYYQRKRAAGKSHKEALRCLKRRLSDTVYRTINPGLGFLSVASDLTQRGADPGFLIHVDVIKFGNIPDGGGWRFVGKRHCDRNREATAKRTGRGHMAAVPSPVASWSSVRARACSPARRPHSVRPCRRHLRDVGQV